MARIAILLLVVMMAGCGAHYDCYNLRKYAHDPEVLTGAIEYCMDDRMTDWTRTCGTADYQGPAGFRVCRHKRF